MARYRTKSDTIQGFVAYQYQYPTNKGYIIATTKENLQKHYHKVFNILKRQQTRGDGILTHADTREIANRLRK